MQTKTKRRFVLGLFIILSIAVLVLIYINNLDLNAILSAEAVIEYNDPVVLNNTSLNFKPDIVNITVKKSINNIVTNCALRENWNHPGCSSSSESETIVISPEPITVPEFPNILIPISTILGFMYFRFKK